jgi:hypothetical protein
MTGYGIADLESFLPAAAGAAELPALVRLAALALRAWLGEKANVGVPADCSPDTGRRVPSAKRPTRCRAFVTSPGPVETVPGPSGWPRLEDGEG